MDEENNIIERQPYFRDADGNVTPIPEMTTPELMKALQFCETFVKLKDETIAKLLERIEKANRQIKSIKEKQQKISVIQNYILQEMERRKITDKSQLTDGEKFIVAGDQYLYQFKEGDDITEIEFYIKQDKIFRYEVA